MTPDCAPFIFFFLVEDRVPSLEVIRVLEKHVVFVRNVLAADGLLDDFIAPFIVEPGMSHDFLFYRRFQQGVGSSCDVQVDLEEMSGSA